MNYPDGMTRSDWIAVGEIDGPLEPLEARVLRAVVYLTYEPGPEEERCEDDEGIEGEQSPYEAEQNIKRALEGAARPYGVTATFGLAFRPDKIEVVDAQYMSEAEADELPYG